MNIRVLSLISFCTIAFGQQANTPIADGIGLRLNALLVPTSDQVNIRYDDDFDYFTYNGDGPELNEGWRAEIGLVGRPHHFTNSTALLVSAMFFYHDQSSSTYGIDDREIIDQPGPLSLSAMGVDLYVALEFALSKYVEFEIGPFVGLGGSTISDVGVGTNGPDSRTEERGHGDYAEIGLNVMLSAHNAKKSVNFGLGLRYFSAYTEGKIRFNLADSSGHSYPGALRENVEITLQGLAPMASLGVNF